MPTTIQIKKETLERLQSQKYTQRQSYDEVLNRILDEVEESSLTSEEIEDLQIALEQVKNNQLFSIESVAKELGIKL